MTTFSATGSPPSSAPSKTMPMRPRPITRVIRYGPRESPGLGSSAISGIPAAQIYPSDGQGPVPYFRWGSLAQAPPDRRHLLVISLMDRPELGDYRIEGIVGVGRTGIVYLATDSRTGRAVALKVLREDVSIDPIYRERFRREGALLATLRHPHIIPIYGMGELDGDLFIATRLVSGTLKNLIMAGPISVDVAMNVITAVAEAVDTAHVAGIVHRDVKPANVLLDPGPQVYLGDFGLARDPDGAALTVPGQVIGTLDYMAPEHLDAEGVGTAGRHLRAHLHGGGDAHRRGPLPARHRRRGHVRTRRR